MEADAGEPLDWEVLHSNFNSESESGISSSAENSDQNDFEEVDSHANGVIQSNYFSIESGEERYSRAVSETAVADKGSENSDNPSWIEPTSENHYSSKGSVEFWPDSGSDPGDEGKVSEFDEKSKVGFVGNEKLLVDNHEIEETCGGNGGKSGDDEELWARSGEMGLGDMKVGDFEEDSEVGCRNNRNLEVLDHGNVGGHSTGGPNIEVESGIVEGGEKKTTVVWWKVPMEFFKFCVFRVNPLWTFSAAAAFVGLVFLGRRLYKMKKAARGLKLKVTMDDKKISQFMSRAARLNEAFSIVKRGPVVRPTLPAAGVTPWPVMSLR